MNKYIEQIKQKPFIIAFVLLSIIGCVVYSYHFQILTAFDDDFYHYDMYEYGTTQGFSESLKHRARIFGEFLIMIFSDATMAKNVTLFLTIIGSAFGAIFFTRFGLKVQSIFWSVLLATPLIANASLQVHYTFILAIIRFTSTCFLLAMVSAVLVRNKWSYWLSSTLILTLIISVYQPILFEYVNGIILMVIFLVYKNQDKTIFNLFKDISLGKIIPAIMTLLTAYALNILWVLLMDVNNALSISLKRKHDGILSFIIDAINLSMGRGNVIGKNNLSMFHHFDNKVREIIDYILFNFYPASLDNLHTIFTILGLSSLIGCFIIFKQQKIIKQISLALIVIFLFLFAVVSTTIEIKMQSSLRVMVQASVIIVMLLYVNYLAYNNLKWLKIINASFLTVLVLQICNQTVYKSYKQLLANHTNEHIYQRLFSDILGYVKDHKIQKKIPVFFIVAYENNQTGLQLLKPDEWSLIYDYTFGYYVSRFMDIKGKLVSHGANEFIKLVDPNVYKTYMQDCKNIVKDKSIAKWPFYNSMTMVNDVLYVKLTHDTGSYVCGLSAAFQFKQGRIDFKHNSYIQGLSYYNLYN